MNGLFNAWVDDQLWNIKLCRCWKREKTIEKFLVEN